MSESSTLLANDSESSEVPDPQATPHRAVDEGLCTSAREVRHLEPELIQETWMARSHYWALLLSLFISMRSTRIGPIAASVLPGTIDQVERSVWLSHTLSVPLSIITVAWWGSMSDYRGRSWALRWNVTAYVLSDLGLLLLWKTRSSMHAWYMIGPVIEGLAGGLPTPFVLLQAYIADTTNSNARTRALSQLLGLLFVGMMIGPQINLYGVSFGVFGRPMIYTLAASNTAAMLLVWLVIPESLPSTDINERHRARREQLQALGSGRRAWFKRTASTLNVMTPFIALLPRRPTRLTHRRSFDWNFPLIGGAYAIAMLIGQSGSRLSVFYDQYYEAASVTTADYVYITYGWMASEFFMWTTFINRLKGIWLLVLFPAISKLIIYCWTRFRTPRTGSGELEPLLTREQRSQHQSPSPARLAVSWDLFFARSALATSALFYGLAPRAKGVGAFIDDVLFFAATQCTVFGSHFGPAAQSLALGIDREPGSDTGRASNPRTGQILGALGAMGTLSSHVVGPMLFELVYARTKSSLPGALYLVHSGLLLVSFVLLMFVRTGVRDIAVESSEEEGVVEESTGASTQ
ncbi:hypothetical protein C8Q80DRAFT_860939 [Daedaleopsis nitida]|nr:hypothetical protein C8Q80DRAFT_860939 [Daedaleopsis nitida]